MRRWLKGLLGLALVGAGLGLAITSPRGLALIKGFEEPIPPKSTDVENGRRIFYAGGCASCHTTPGQDDRLKLGGGFALPSPFGTFYAPNISSDPKDGIGAWSAADLIRAMRQGVSPDGRHYYPAFPFASYQRMSDQDIGDLHAFLKTLAPVAGRARDHDLPFPFSIRLTLGGWKLLFLDGARFAADGGQSLEWNRGAYLVNGPGHCGECHSPRNLLGGIVAAKRLSGGPDPEGKGYVPNITPHATGIGKWSKSEVMELLKTGFTPDYDSVGGSMGAVIKNMAELPEADRAAIAEYLLHIPPIEGRKKPEK